MKLRDGNQVTHRSVDQRYPDGTRITQCEFWIGVALYASIDLKLADDDAIITCLRCASGWDYVG